VKNPRLPGFRGRALVLLGLLALAGGQARAAFNADVLVTNLFDGKVAAYDPANGNLVGTFGGSPYLSNARGIVVGPDGNIFINDISLGGVQEFDPNGNFLKTFVTKGEGGLSQPYGMAFGPSGHLFVSATGTGLNSVFEYDAAGAFVKSFGAADGLSAPTGLTFGPGNNLFVVSSGNNQILEFNQSGAFVKSFTSGVTAVSGLAFGGGFLYAANGTANSGTFYKIDATTGAVVNTFTDPANLKTPGGLVVGGDNNVYIVDLGSNRVARFTPAGTFAGLFTAGAPLNGPIELTGAPVPEPASLVLFALGACGLAAAAARRGRARTPARPS